MNDIGQIIFSLISLLIVYLYFYGTCGLIHPKNDSKPGDRCHSVLKNTPLIFGIIIWGLTACAVFYLAYKVYKGSSNSNQPI